MDVSIVIVSYNTERLLDDCLASIPAECRRPYEVIVVDNASKDNTLNMLKGNYPDVIVIENKRNVGFASANNQGFEVASGEYFLMLNPDTIVLDGAIDKLMDYMDQHSEVGICGPKNLDPDMNLQYNCDHFPSIWNEIVRYMRLDAAFPNVRLFNLSLMRYWDYKELREVDRMMGCSLLIRADAFRRVGGLDANFFMYFEETDLCYQIRRIGYRVVYYPNAKIIHYGGETYKSLKQDNVFGNTVMNYFIPSKYYYFKKNCSTVYAFFSRLLDINYGILLWLKNYRRKDPSIKAARLAQARTLIRCALNTHK